MADTTVTPAAPAAAPVAQPTAAEIYQQNLAADTRSAFSGQQIVGKPEGQGFWGTLGDTWTEETWIGSAARYGLMKKDKDAAEYDYSPSFNPYKYFVDNADKLDVIKPHLANGGFDDVYSEKQFMDRVERLTAEMEAQKRIAEGSTAGSITGGLLSFADVSSLIPGINVAKKVKTAGTIAKIATSRPVRYAATGAYMSAVQEAGLHALKDLRTLNESELNVVVGAGLGGVLGGAVSAGSRTSLFNPNNPNYVFKEDTKVVMGIKALGQKVSESPAYEAVVKGGKNVWDTVAAVPLPGGASIGAAAVKGVDLAKAGTESLGGIIKPAIQAVGKAGVAAINNTIARATPIGRGLLSASEKVRNLTASLYDAGGILLDGHNRGSYIKSFEDTAEGFKRSMDMLNVHAREVYIGLQIKLAELQGKTTSGLGVAAGDIGSDMKALASDIFSSPSNSGRAKTTDLKADGRLERFEFEDLIESSMRDDVQQEAIDNLKSRFGDKGSQTILDAAKRVGEAIHEHNLNVENELVANGLLREADRLGRSFVAPQMWSGKGIRYQEARAKEFFMRLFAKEPSDDFLEANTITRDQFNKLGKEDVKIGDKEYTAETGLAFKNEILDDWAGALRDDKLAQLELNLRVAEESFQAKRKELILAAREQRRTETDIKNASVEEAEAVLKYRLAAREKARTELEHKRKQMEQYKAEIENAKAEYDANNPEQALKDSIEKFAGDKHNSSVKDAEEMYNMMLKEGDQGDIKTSWEQLVQADNNKWSDQQLALDVAKSRRDYVARIAAKRAAAEHRMTAAKEKLNGIYRDVSNLEGRLARLDGPLEKLLKLTEEAKLARQNLQMVKKLRNAAVKEIKQETGQSKRELKKAKKELRKFKGETLSEHVDNLIDTLSKRQYGMAPLNVIDGAFMESGRTRLRFIKMNNEQIREAKALGLLRGDLMGRLSEGATDIGRQIAMRQVFGHYGSNNDDIVKAIVKEVDADYKRLIAKAQADGKTGLVKRLEREQRTFIGESGADGDIVKGFKRQFGRLDLPTDPESVLGWIVGKAREFNFIRYGSGFLISSLTDVANVAMTSGFGVYSYKVSKGVNRTISGMANPEIRRMVQALELVMHNSRNFKLNSVDDMRLMAGIGDYGTVKHHLTSTTDRLFNGMSQTTSYMSGMLWWNTRLKMAAMVEMQHNFVEKAMIYDRLLKEASAGDKAAELEIARLASLGLGAEQMRGVQAMIAKHAPANTDGLYELGMSRWLKEGEVGKRAYDDVLTALDHVAGRAVMTPSKGDTPFLMSDPYFKMLLQFQTYGFAIVNRFLLPGFQRMANYGDMEAFLSFGLALSMGGAVTAAKDLLNDGKIKDRTALEWGYDAIDRAGFLAYLSSYLSAGAKLAGLNGSSRYSQDRAVLPQVLGPTGSLVQDVHDLASGIAQGDGERAKKAAWKLAPLNTYRKVIGLATGQ